MSTPTDPWFHLAPCGLISVSADGLLLEVNDRFLAWTGRTSEEVVGRPFVAFLDGGSRLFYETRYLPTLHLEGEVSEVALTLIDAEGNPLSMLVNSSVDAGGQVIRSALFYARERRQYETELLNARRVAESSEARVRVLQDISSTFGVSASDEDVAQSFVEVARSAFVAKHAAVLLLDDNGDLVLVAGTNPLEGRVPPVLSLRNTPRVVVVEEQTARDDFPQLAAAMRDTRLASLSITPLLGEGQRLGILVCFFGRRTEFDDHFFELQKALGRQASQTLVRVRLQRRLAFLALHDQLTGVANRQLLQTSLDEAIARADATGQPLGVLFLDVDRFKEINDQFGHATGDAVLVELATRLRKGVRANDVVGRIGGDEFVAICADADIDAATSIGQRVLQMARAPIAVSGGVISASFSVGVSLYRPGRDRRPAGEDLLVRADGAMYQSKGHGKDRVTVESVPPE